MNRNKLSILTSIVLLYSLSAISQIRNRAFDELTADTTIVPWKVKSVMGYSYKLDKTTKHSGTSALKLYSVKNEKDSFMPFSQEVPIVVTHVKRIAITAYIKCENVETESTLWCQVWDENNKKIGFQNLGALDVTVKGTTGWIKYTMPITVDSKAKKLLMGGYLSGTGTVWFDDFDIEELSEHASPASPAVAKYINDFIDIIKKNSIYTTGVAWPQVEKDVITLSNGLTKVEETRPVLDYILDQLRSAGDNHSFIQNKVAASEYAAGNSNPSKPASKLLSGNIGYILVPGFSSINEKVSTDFATEIQNMIRKLDTNNQIAGWIVDLRGNTGGNMYPMIAGLGPLTGEGTLGYFIGIVNNKKIRNPWFYKSGSSGAGKTTVSKASNPYKVKNAKTKIAVLIDPLTSSSGEMTAISFIGKKNSRVFGSQSGGYTTGNAAFSLSDGANLLLATSYTADRNLKQYKAHLTPDVTVKQSSGSEDEGIKAAMLWLGGSQ